MKLIQFSLLILGIVTFQLVQGQSTQKTKKNPAEKVIKIEKNEFGTLPDGTKAELFTLRNSSGMEAQITNYGGIITSLTAPDKNGKYENVTLGCEALDAYLKGVPFFGALVGRYGNRIGKGKFTLNGQEYTLAKNNGPNALHGGKKGFDKVLWKATAMDSQEPQLKLNYTSVDGEEGYLIIPMKLSK